MFAEISGSLIGTRQRIINKGKDESKGQGDESYRQEGNILSIPHICKL
jgi:hypothetical protein